MSSASAMTEMLAEIACYHWCFTLLVCLCLSLYRRNRYDGLQTSSIRRLASSTLEPHDGHTTSESEPVITWAYQSSPLLNLPAEVRNKIYREVLVSEGRVPCTPHLLLPNLRPLHVCRQIRAEGESIFWVENDFLALIFNGHPTGIEDWSRLIGRRRTNMITRLSIGISFTEEHIQRWKEALAREHDTYVVAMMCIKGVTEFLPSELDAARANGVPKTSFKTIDPEPPCETPGEVERIIACIHLTVNAKVRAALELPPEEGNDHGWKDVLADGTFIFSVVEEDPISGRRTSMPF